MEKCGEKGVKNADFYFGHFLGQHVEERTGQTFQVLDSIVSQIFNRHDQSQGFRIGMVPKNLRILSTQIQVHV